MIKIGSFYYFSMRLPSTQKLFRKSLRTRKLLNAKAIVEAVQDRIEGVRVNADILKLIIDDEIERVISTVTALLLPRSEAGKRAIEAYHNYSTPLHYQNISVDSASGHVSEEVLQKHRITVDSFEDFLLKRINRNVPPRQVDEYDSGYEDYYAQPNAEQALLNSYKEQLSELIHNKDYPKAFDTLQALKQSFNFETHTNKPLERHSSKLPTWEKAVEDMIEDKESALYYNQKRSKRGERISTKAVDEITKFYKIFLNQLFKGKHLDEITSADCDAAFELYSQFPNLKYSPWRQMNDSERFQEAYDGNVPEDKRASGNLIRLKVALNTVFSHYYKRNVIDENPVSKMRFDNYKNGKDRGAYSCTQIQTLLKYCTATELNSYTVALMLSIYCGLRNGEAVKVERKDIIQHKDGFYYLNVRGTKTDNAAREVPLHQNLIKAGIISYFESNPEKISSQQLTVWFNKVATTLRLPAFDDKERMLTYYSTRHSFMTALANAGVSDVQINSIVGHRQVGQKDTYIHGVGIKILNEVVQKLSYDYD